ncbi:flagellar motor protein [Erythrobacter sp. KY5]|uniref:flagellar motor protein MotB n=1 Tax=Erythrobacter sp. KY5 TaxID=2011159 RepID=UPI000DBEF977|nr:flagellar motor protein MotB [Erythrobacter sp. KY5]AWW73553.1 flagellar motor protein [Erythrobacter sp. KY5]
MADAQTTVAPPPIIVRKVTIEAGDGHHGGAWKVAYADFVTAMMAFFLLLWLLGATEENQRRGIADYFAPTLVKTKQQSAGADGMLGGSSLTDVDNYPNAQGQTGTLSITVPRGARGGPMEGGGDGDIDTERLDKLRDQIDEALAKRRPISHLARQVTVMRAPDGIRIDLVDDADFSMFALGTTILTQDARGLLEVIGDVLVSQRAPLILRGHTDSLPWRDGIEANNWSLSAGRAEATRQALIASGLEATRFARIEGVADTEPLIADDPADPRNRRISLLLLEERRGMGRRRAPPVKAAQPASPAQSSVRVSAERTTPRS